MKVVLKSHTLDDTTKYKVLEDFLLFVKKVPAYKQELKWMLPLFSKTTTDSGRVFIELGNFYLSEKQQEIALNYYEKGFKNALNDFKLLKKILLLQLKLERYEKVKASCELAIELYPTQPIVYFVHGKALMKLNKVEKSIETLTSGIDYIIDDVKMESDFYILISEGYQRVGNTKKAAIYKGKASELHTKS